MQTKSPQVRSPKMGESCSKSNRSKLLFAWLLFHAIGCSMTAPMHVWQPALDQPRAVKTIALSPIHGPQELAAKLDRAMLESQPTSASQITLLHPKLLEEMTSIQMVVIRQSH